jgi:hypothetical protein
MYQTANKIPPFHLFNCFRSYHYKIKNNSIKNNENKIIQTHVSRTNLYEFDLFLILSP